ncbi:MAG: hypothetical protein GY696_39630 [Gammaproteobacteria bacterium]|nr:hypothetical protein [Gammaproteobacteria bacterium]
MNHVRRELGLRHKPRWGCAPDPVDEGAWGGSLQRGLGRSPSGVWGGAPTGSGAKSQRGLGRGSNRRRPPAPVAMPLIDLDSAPGGSTLTE